MGRFKYIVSKYYASIITGLGVAWLLDALISVFIPGVAEAATWIWPTFVAGAIILAIGRIPARMFPRQG